MSRLGYQIPNFTYPGVSDAELFATIVAQAKEADSSGFDRLTLMDHFYQLPMIGDPDEPMLECYTMLAALAQHTENVRLSALVTGNTYRNPAVLAKEITTIDLVSNGRATLGIGAGWYEAEHSAYGIEFGTFTDRFEKLEEALQIILPMLRGERPSVDGKHYKTIEAINSPAPLSKIPIMIGGNGERKTLRMVAQYADESNLVSLSSPDQIGPKLEALDAHCKAVGRDRSEITVTLLLPACIASTMAEAEAEVLAGLEAKGRPTMPMEAIKQMVLVGDGDAIAQRLAPFKAAGLDGISLSLMFNGHIPGRIKMLADAASSVFG